MPRSILAILFIVTLLLPTDGLTQSNPTYIQFSPAAVKAALYKPDAPQLPAHVGILVVHRTSNVMGSLSCVELAKRGFMVLCLNPRSDNNEALVKWETMALDVKSGVNVLKKQPGITKVLLLGGSGGGPTMSFYQAVAENGIAYCQQPQKLMKCGKELADLPKADGIIFRDAHPGNPVIAGVRNLNPAVINDAAVMNDNRPVKIDPALDPFDPKNGYNPKGPSSYSEKFKKAYFEGQAKRMNRLIALAQERLRRIEASAYPNDDAPFVIARGDAGKLFQLDLSILHSTAAPRKLLKNDGTIDACCVIESVRVAVPDIAKQNPTFDGGTLFLTVRSFLSANAVRATNSLDGLDHCSSNNSTICALQQISVPVLFGAMSGHYFVRDNEIHYEVAKSADKDFITVEGATHGITPCTECEKTPGQYSNTVKNFFDYVAKWVNARF
ncbi:MAG: hypothetical protein EXR70_20355 [Deltaproteobacteria bacterium]|nr:hypothetical protein [Deltaproteobacteria bacterium]